MVRHRVSPLIWCGRRRVLLLPEQLWNDLDDLGRSAVLLHELAHLKEMNHGPRFWALCKKLCPGMEEAKSWLKRHGSQLHAIDFD